MPSIGRRLARRYLPDGLREVLIRASGGRLGDPAANASPTQQRRPGAQPRKPAHPVSKFAAKAPRPAVAENPFVDRLRRGGSLPAATLGEIRALVGRGDHAAAAAMATALRRDPETEQLGAAAGGVVAFLRGYPVLAWTRLRDLPHEVWAVHTPEEYVRAGLAADPTATLERVGSLADEAPATVPIQSWLAMLGPVFGHGDMELARRLFVLLDECVGSGEGVEQSLVVNRDWLRPWVAASPDGATAPAPEDGSVSFAIMDYGHPGRARASANIGDHVQSLASLGHVVRHQNLEFTGPQDLVDLVHQLHGRVRPEMQLTDVDARLRLVSVDRDASTFSAIPENTWTLAFGWFMHPIFDMRYGFPFHPNLVPIFLSFHCSKRELITEDAIEYLRKFAPIGCRDWTTVHVLLSVGVPAFFSGCMTTTVSTVFPDAVQRPGPDAQVAYVDVPSSTVPDGAPRYVHSDDAIRFRSFATNMYDAIDLLETYRREHSGLVTSRLHCYLPGRSIGVPVDFQPKNRSDPRFAGLIDITDTEFDRMRSTISAKLRPVLSAAFSGKSPEDVYALWAEVNAEDVAEARRRHTQSSDMPAAKVDVPGEVATVRSRNATGAAVDGTTHLVVHCPAGSVDQLGVLLRSVAEHASSPVTAWVLTRRPRQLDAERLAESTGLDVRVISTAGLGADLRRADGSKPRPRDVDLLALPLLLADVDRVVLLPVDAVVLGDVAELAGLSLDGELFAAPAVVGTRGSSGFGLLHAAASRLGVRTAASAELRRQGHARHRFDFDAFDPDVLVIDLAAARERRLTDTYVPYVEEFSLTFREVLLLEAGPHRAVVPERWHVVPDRTEVADPALVHWAESGKPWSGDAVEAQALWLEAHDRLHVSVDPR